MNKLRIISAIVGLICHVAGGILIFVFLGWKALLAIFIWSMGDIALSFVNTLRVMNRP